MSWWTPGQYLIPGLLTESGLSLGRALTVTTLLFSCIGIVGWYQAYRTLGFSEAVAWLTCGIITCNRFFVLPFGIYNGGEVLLFGSSPYLILAGLWAVNGPWLRAMALIPVFMLGFVLKNSALILALAVCAALIITTWRTGSRQRQFVGWIRWPLAFVITYATTFILYTSQGPTPITFEPHVVDRAAGKGMFAMAAPFLSSLSVDESLSWILGHPSRPLYPDWQLSLPIIVPLALIACAAYWWVGRTYIRTRYGTFLLIFLGTYIVAHFPQVAPEISAPTR
jgi:hypothetical protein